MSYVSVRNKAVDAVHALFDEQTDNRPADLQIVRAYGREELKGRRIELYAGPWNVDMPGADGRNKGRSLCAVVAVAVTNHAVYTRQNHLDLCAYIEANLMRSDLAVLLTAAVVQFRCMRVTAVEAMDDESEEDEIRSPYMVQLHCILEAT